jgi:integrase
MPFTSEEMLRILDACDKYPDIYKPVGQPNSKRMKAFVLLMGYSGMRIGDTITCAMDRS